MTFDSIDALKNYILSHSEVAIKIAQEKAYQIIENFLKQYYSEFSPSVYERTYQLLRSLVRADIVHISNGWTAEVYFDINALDYHMKRINGVEVPNKGWSEEKTLHEAMVGGTHGGYVAPSNTQIWTESIAVLNTEMYKILKQELIKAGIPIK